MGAAAHSDPSTGHIGGDARNGGEVDGALLRQHLRRLATAPTQARRPSARSQARVARARPSRRIDRMPVLHPSHRSGRARHSKSSYRRVRARRPAPSMGATPSRLGRRKRSTTPASHDSPRRGRVRISRSSRACMSRRGASRRRDRRSHPVQARYRSARGDASPPRRSHRLRTRPRQATAGSRHNHGRSWRASAIPRDRQPPRQTPTAPIETPMRLTARAAVTTTVRMGLATNSRAIAVATRC